MKLILKSLNYLLFNRAQFCDCLVKYFLGFLPDKLYLSLRYRILMGKWINWKQPKLYQEKLQWLKVYNRQKRYTEWLIRLPPKIMRQGL